MRRAMMSAAVALVAVACGGDDATTDVADGPVQPGGCIQIEAGEGAASTGFLTDSVEIEANDRPIRICFENGDEGVPHNVAIAGEHGGELLFNGEVVEGPATVRYELPDLEPGMYHFHCEIHPDTMTGTLEIVEV